MRVSAIAIHVYKIVHTGANIQFGGVNHGLVSVAYHNVMEGIVNALPIAATE
jgi:hypothetical protein